MIMYIAHVIKQGFIANEIAVAISNVSLILLLVITFH